MRERKQKKHSNDTMEQTYHQMEQVRVLQREQVLVPQMEQGQAHQTNWGQVQGNQNLQGPTKELIRTIHP